MIQVSNIDLASLFDKIDSDESGSYFDQIITEFLQDQPYLGKFIEDARLLLDDEAFSVCIETSSIIWKVFSNLTEGQLPLVEQEEIADKVTRVKELFEQINFLGSTEPTNLVEKQLRLLLFENVGTAQPSLMHFIAGLVFGIGASEELNRGITDHEKGVLYVILRTITELLNDSATSLFWSVQEPTPAYNS